MWRGPLAYGHAGATRIFCDDCDRTCSLGGRGRATDDTSGREAGRGQTAEREQREPDQHERCERAGSVLPDLRVRERASARTDRRRGCVGRPCRRVHRPEAAGGGRTTGAPTSAVRRGTHGAPARSSPGGRCQGTRRARTQVSHRPPTASRARRPVVPAAVRARMGPARPRRPSSPRGHVDRDRRAREHRDSAAGHDAPAPTGRACASAQAQLDDRGPASTGGATATADDGLGSQGDSARQARRGNARRSDSRHSDSRARKARWGQSARDDRLALGLRRGVSTDGEATGGAATAGAAASTGGATGRRGGSMAAGGRRLAGGAGGRRGRLSTGGATGAGGATAAGWLDRRRNRCGRRDRRGRCDRRARGATAREPAARAPAGTRAGRGSPARRRSS